MRRRNTDAHSNGNSYSDANSDSHTYIDGNGYHNADIYCYRGAEVYGDAQAASHAGPTPIMSLVSRLSVGTRERA